MLAYPNISPIAVHIGPFAIRWYALAYLTGVLAGWWLVGKLNKRLIPPTLTAEAFDDIMVWAILGIILGGRFGYVLFYKPGFYLFHPLEIFKVWEGGMSFHGGLLGVIIAVLLFARKFRIPFFAVTDLMAAVAPIGLCLGRLANFVNGELYGRPTDSALAMVFPTDPDHLPRYPSQLLEAGLEGVLLFCVLMTLAVKTRTLRHTGRLSGLFLIGYCCARSVSELFREPDSFIHFLPDWITMGQLLSLPMLAFGLYLALRPLPHSRFMQFLLAAQPMTVAGYMQRCNAYYYATRDPLGASGDFTTSPEISQIFGEIVGAWLADVWRQAGAKRMVLCEMGPGRGTLMRDALRATRTVNGFHEALEIRLIETSPALTAVQQETLRDAHPNITWHESLDDLPGMPLLLVANEFFDALPIEQYVNGTKRTVAHDGAAFSWKPEGAVTHETCLAATAVMTRIATHIKAFGGAALVVDYGYHEGEQCDTLQAVHRHQYADPLLNPGEADLTAHVDFAALAQAAEGAGAHAFGLADQGTFLKRLGAELRATALCKTATPQQRDAILSGLERLVAPQEMGTLFKVMAVTSSLEPPPGF